MERLVAAALAALPSQFRARLTNLHFSVVHGPTRLERRRLGLGSGTLYGLYEGLPLTQRDSAYDRAMPDRITIYWGPLLRDFPAEEALAAEVRKTVYHEIAHYFGLDEEDLERTSVE